MTDRAAAIALALGDRVLYSPEPLTDGGIHVEFDVVWAHPGQIAAMAEALSDVNFARFLTGLVEFVECLRFLLDKQEFDNPTVLFFAQVICQERMPDEYALLDQVFQL